MKTIKIYALLFTLSFLCSTLSAQDTPVDTAPTDKELSCKDGNKVETFQDIPEFAFCSETAAEAKIKYIKAIIKILKVNGFKCKDLAACPPETPCKMAIKKFDGGIPEPEQDLLGKWVFEMTRKKLTVYCRCEETPPASDDTDDGGEGHVDDDLIFEEDYHDVVFDFVKIYPNPANDYVEIKLSNELVLKNQTISIIGTNGQQVKQLQLLPGQLFHQINTSDLPSGMYFMSLYEGNQLLDSQSFMVNHE